MKDQILGYDTEAELWPEMPGNLLKLAADARAAHRKPLKYLKFFEPKPYEGGLVETATEFGLWIKHDCIDAYNIGHELAHMLSYSQREVPRLHPTLPQGMLRLLVADVISLLDHQYVMQILQQYEIEIDENNRRQSAAFLDAINAVNHRGGAFGDLRLDTVFFVIRYVMIRTCYFYEQLSVDIMRAVQKHYPRIIGGSDLITGQVTVFLRDPGDMYDAILKVMEMLSFRTEWEQFMFRPSCYPFVDMSDTSAPNAF